MKSLLRCGLLLFAGTLWGQVPAPQVYFSAPIGPSGIFPAFNAGTVVFALDADYTMSYPDMSAFFIKATSSVSLTTTRKLIAPLTIGFVFTIENATTGGQSIEVIGSTGTGVTIPNGQAVQVVADGTNYVSAGTTSGMVYPPAGVANSTGSAWGTSYQVGTSANNLVQLNSSAALPAVNGANLTSLNGANLQASSVANAALANNSMTINGTSCTLGGSCTPSGGSYSLGGSLSCSNLVFGTGAGTGPVCGDVTGLDGNHLIQITVGSSPTAGQVIYTLNFTASRGHNTYCTYSWAEAPVGAVNPNSFFILNDGPSAYETVATPSLAAGEDMTFNVSCP